MDTKLRFGRALALIGTILGSFLFPISARNGSEPLNHYGLSALQDQAIGIKLAGRFKAKGQPVFMIHDPNIGLSQGDIMRFQDRAVLIDADVWQTLQDEGALNHLKSAPLLRIQAKATVGTWETRAKLVNAPREKKAYEFGAELLKILEETFGGIPSREQMSIVFDGASLVLLAPEQFLDQLKYSIVRRVPIQGKPHFISESPERLFLGDSLSYQVWAADPSEPAGLLRYSLNGELPKGLTWDANTHTLSGTVGQEGHWRLLAEAGNKTGLFDTLVVSISVRKNKPPTLAHPPKPVAVAGQLWTYLAEAVDPDHEGGQILISAPQMPQGMEFDSLNHRFQWTPATDSAGKKVTLELRLVDPKGGLTDSLYTLKILPATDLLWSEGIKPTLPWDTLQQGKTYAWEAGASAMAWAQQGITLTEIKGPDSTIFQDGSLRIRPMQPGPFKLLFVFEVSGKSMEQVVDLPVRPDLPPHFQSEVGTWRLITGQPASYRPIAIDDEGVGVTLEAETVSDEQLSWDGVHLRLNPKYPGTYAARLVAIDPAGHADTQWVAYHVEKAERPIAWFMETNWEGSVHTYTLTADFGTGRMGLFTPHLNTIGLTSKSGQRQWPYLFFGGNLLGRENEKRGKRLWVDAGITVRMPNSAVATGGVFGRILGEWTFPGQALGKVEFEMQGHVNQAIVVADTSNLNFIYGDAILEFAQKFSPMVDQIIREATARDNMYLFTRLEAWTRLSRDFWIGPGIWREEQPNSHIYIQRLSGGLRYQGRYSEGLMMQSLHVGWGNGGGWALFWNMRLAYHSPF